MGKNVISVENLHFCVVGCGKQSQSVTKAYA